MNEHETHKAIGIAILEAEDRALEILKQVPAAEGELATTMQEAATRAGKIPWLRGGCRSAEKAGDARWRDAARELDRAVELQWELALSIHRLYTKRAMRRAFPGHVEGEDLVQQGALGAYEAARRWDPHRGVSFPTYATWWIRASMERHIQRAERPVPHTGLILEDMLRLEAAIREVMARGGDTRGEIAKAADLSVERVDQLFAMRIVERLDTPLPTQFDDSDSCLAIDLLTDERDQDEIVENACLIERALFELGRLDARTAEIVRRYYAIGGGDEETLADIGRSAGLSRERVRQIRTGGIARIRAAMEEPRG